MIGEDRLPLRRVQLHPSFPPDSKTPGGGNDFVAIELREELVVQRRHMTEHLHVALERILPLGCDVRNRICQQRHRIALLHEACRKLRMKGRQIEHADDLPAARRSTAATDIVELAESRCRYVGLEARIEQEIDTAESIGDAACPGLDPAPYKRVRIERLESGNELPAKQAVLVVEMGITEGVCQRVDFLCHILSFPVTTGWSDAPHACAR